jgi:hypothetical protein
VSGWIIAAIVVVVVVPVLVFVAALCKAAASDRDDFDRVWDTGSGD